MTLSDNLIIQKVENGYIVRDLLRGDYSNDARAVFNDVNDLCDWIKRNFVLAAQVAHPQPGAVGHDGLARGVNPLNTLMAASGANLKLNDAGTITGIEIPNTTTIRG